MMVGWLTMILICGGIALVVWAASPTAE